ncbi:hypothetical protein PENSUB_2131 [Penicillium subrubescens]|uniref:Uncharacterized protein n=1 Tax=Penicillium subrubescens TaxID=1316194 RepID=A0A1Q5UIS2_9EURO|nr:hypothetical protein PENSUB_2131 [Penicillium subrubescens]
MSELVKTAYIRPQNGTESDGFPGISSGFLAAGTVYNNQFTIYPAGSQEQSLLAASRPGGDSGSNMRSGARAQYREKLCFAITSTISFS